MFTVSDTEKEYISVSEAARRIGVTAAYIYQLIRMGKLTAYQRGLNDRKFVDWHEVEQSFQIRPVDEGE